MAQLTLTALPEPVWRHHATWLGASVALSLALHGTLYVFLARPQGTRATTDTPVRMEIIEPPPPPPAPPTPHAPAPVHARPQPKPPPPPKATPPPPNQPPPTKAAPPPPIHIGLSLSSTVASGGFAAPVGNTLAGRPDNRAADPNQVAPLPDLGGPIVPSYALSEAPTVDAEPDMRAYYPDEARKQELEGQVQLRLSIDTTGKVLVAEVMRGAGNGFDEAAVRAARERLHFKPARLNGKPVPTQITYKFTFLLD